MLSDGGSECSDHRELVASVTRASDVPSDTSFQFEAEAASPPSVLFRWALKVSARTNPRVHL